MLVKSETGRRKLYWILVVFHFLYIKKIYLISIFFYILISFLCTPTQIEFYSCARMFSIFLSHLPISAVVIFCSDFNFVRYRCSPFDFPFYILPAVAFWHSTFTFDDIHSCSFLFSLSLLDLSGCCLSFLPSLLHLVCRCCYAFCFSPFSV